MLPRMLDVQVVPTATNGAVPATPPHPDHSPRKSISPASQLRHVNPSQQQQDAEKRLSLPVGPLLTIAPPGCAPTISATAATQAVKKAAGSISRATLAGAKKIKSDTDSHLASAAETALNMKNFFPGATTRTNTSPQLSNLQPKQEPRAGSPLVKAPAAASGVKPGRRDSTRPHPRSRLSADGTFTVFVEDYHVPLLDGSGFLPMDRECTRQIFAKGSQKGAVLLIPGFASNRQMFHLGGGVGKTGPSFSEFLAKREYDVYAVDLRGTTESIALGAKRAAGMREYVEVDIPSAIQMIKQIGGYEQVYLIGHSMGGALSCAVAGICPDDVAGVIHLAGLYHYTLPGLSEIIDLYKAFCPRPIKAVVRTSSTLAVRTASAVLSPVMSGASYVLGMNGSKSIPATQPSSNGKATDTPSSTDASASNSDANEHGPTPSQMEAASLIPPPPPRPPLLHYTQQFVTHLKRQPIPVKTGLNIMLFLRQFVPERIEKALMNALYPSPWVANSVEDPWGLMKASVESPSVGVYLSIAQMAIHHEYYNNWVASSSVHRAEVASDDSQQGPPDAARTASANSTSSDGSNTSTSTSKRKANQDLSEEESWNELTTYLRKFESLEKLPLFFCYANADGVIRMKDSLVGYERSGSFWKDVIHYEDEVLDAQVSDSAKATASGSGSGSGSRKAANEEADGKLRGKIVEGVKESFEDCVKVLRTGSDNVGSRTPSLQKTGNPMEDISFITHAQDTNLAVPTLTGTHHHHGSPASYSGTEDNDEFLQSLHDDATKKVRFSPLIDDADAAGSILWAPRKSFSSTSLYTLPKRSHQHHPRPPPRTKFTSAVKAAAEATAADSSSSSQAHRFSAHLPATSSTAEDTAATAAGEGTSSQQQPFKPAFPAVFSLDAGTSYGHIDVLGGVHAEVLWVCIAEWLEKTTSRNRQWGFWRRYSAK